MNGGINERIKVNYEKEFLKKELNKTENQRKCHYLRNLFILESNLLNKA